ncbi:hypothetical protein OEW28_02880 [Defluviimonas sp. WL0002]|uniref:Uncharacterized protein n=1 Tax=Albidovulum marisflavi TaxID=2984159 RepID=A0ABT2Z8V7_9RHOB|nr:hypothetical protein [Defluviimonas sp. WL0002]MCV2867569.1 hypothetical protein [Defluviimonas sp. WL0002]
MPGESLHPSGESRQLWTVWLTIKTGMLPRETRFTIFYSEDEAKEFMASNAVGSEIKEAWQVPGELSDPLKVHYTDIIDSKSSVGFRSYGDLDSPLAFETLEAADIYLGQGLTQQVIDFIGELRADELRRQFGQNWRAAGAFEYCLMNLPRSSAAYVAAAYQYHYYVAENDFAAGYYWRDLEVIALGVESAASDVKAMRKNAGDKGTKASRDARKRRMHRLLDAMETVCTRNPDVKNPSVISEIALAECKKAEPQLWKNGAGQIKQYLVEIRVGDAGEALQARYASLFPAKPPKRLRP